jgi:formylmethanofuran dehydrogenase subunit E
MTEEDQTLLKEYVRVRTTSARIFVEVKMVDESGEDPLATRWSLASALPANASHVQLDRARKMALADYRYFRSCDTCGEKFPAGKVPSQGDGKDVCRECGGAG